VRAVSEVEEAASHSESRNVEEDAQDTKQQHLSIVDIHQQVLARIKPQRPRSNADETSIETLQYRLNILKRKRVSLESELERDRVSLTTVSEELLHNHNNDEQQSVSKHPRHTNLNDYFIVAEQRMALRTKRRIAGSHRLAGISVVPCENDVLGIRLDICVTGRYVNRHYLFFQQHLEQRKVEEQSKGEKEAAEDEEVHDNAQEEPGEQHDGQSRQLKLVQHTLPQGLLASLDGRSLDLSFDTLQRYIGDAYDACYNHAVRQDAVDFLKSQGDCGIRNVECSNSLDCIVFQLQCGDTQLRILLRYKDPLSSLPGEVKVSHVATLAAAAAAQPANLLFNNDTVMEVSSDEDEDTGILSAAREVFQSCEIRQAVQKVKGQSAA